MLGVAAKHMKLPALGTSELACSKRGPATCRALFLSLNGEDLSCCGLLLVWNQAVCRIVAIDQLDAGGIIPTEHAPGASCNLGIYDGYCCS